jgi:hypothetical protein
MREYRRPLASSFAEQRRQYAKKTGIDQSPERNWALTRRVCSRMFASAGDGSRAWRRESAGSRATRIAKIWQRSGTPRTEPRPRVVRQARQPLIRPPAPDAEALPQISLVNRGDWSPFEPDSHLNEVQVGAARIRQDSHCSQALSATCRHAGGLHPRRDEYDVLIYQSTRL